MSDFFFFFLRGFKNSLFSLSSSLPLPSLPLGWVWNVPHVASPNCRTPPALYPAVKEGGKQRGEAGNTAAALAVVFESIRVVDVAAWTPTVFTPSLLLNLYYLWCDWLEEVIWCVRCPPVVMRLSMLVSVVKAQWSLN